MIEKTVELGFLFDFYGKLLSKRQYTIIELFYIYDLSLTEIGEEMDITRQGVYDTLQRAEQKLYKYEENLGLIKKFKKIEDNLENILSVSKDIEKIARENNNKTILFKTKEIQQTANRILENSEEGLD
jgi:uncharacterized protein